MENPKQVYIGDAALRGIQGGFEVLEVIGEDIDLPWLQAVTLEVIKKYTLIMKDEMAEYHAICLQSDWNSSNPLYGDVDQQYAHSVMGISNWPTEVGVAYGRFLDMLKRYADVRRGRLLRADPGLVMNWHSDGEGNRRLHVPIFSTPECRFEYKSGGSYWLNPGKLYMINAEPEHRVINPGPAPRYHLVFRFRPNVVRMRV